MQGSDLSLDSVIAQIMHMVGRFVQPAVDHDICRDLGVDSVNVLDLSLMLEAQFGIIIDDTDLVNARTIGQMGKLVQSLGIL